MDYLYSNPFVMGVVAISALIIGLMIISIIIMFVYGAMCYAGVVEHDSPWVEIATNTFNGTIVVIVIFTTIYLVGKATIFIFS